MSAPALNGSTAEIHEGVAATVKGQRQSESSDTLDRSRLDFFIVWARSALRDFSTFGSGLRQSSLTIYHDR